MGKGKRGIIKGVAASALAFGMVFSSPLFPEVLSGFGEITAGADITESGKCGDDLTYLLDDAGLLTVSGTGRMYNYGNSPSDDEEESPFYAIRDKIKNAVIEEGVTSVGGRAFSHCYDLESVVIPDTVTTIEGSAFYKCSSLTQADIPDSVTSIGYQAFRESGLEDLSLSDSLTDLGEYAFTGTFIDILKIPESVTYIPTGCFSDCEELVSVEIADSVTGIMPYAFYGCSALVLINIPEKTESIGIRSLYGINAETLYIPESVRTIGYDAFGSNDNITDIYYAGTEEQWKSTDLNDLYYYNENSDITQASTVKEYLGLSEDVIFNFLGDDPDAPDDPDEPEIPVVPSGVYTSQSAVIAGETFDLIIKIPAAAHNADSVSIKVEFDADVFEVISWYSNEEISKIMTNATAYTEPGFVSVSAGNTTYPIDMSEPIILKAKIRVDTDASTDDYTFTLKQKKIVYFDEEEKEVCDLWYPINTTAEVSVTNNVIHGTVSGYGRLTGDIRVDLIDSSGETVDSTTAYNGFYRLSRFEPDETYTMRFSMRGCPSRTYTVTASDLPLTHDAVLHMYGDVNGDGEIDSKDATQIIRFDVGVPGLIRNAQGIVDEYLKAVACIVSKNGTPYSADATQILRYDAGMTSLLPKM